MLEYDKRLIEHQVPQTVEGQLDMGGDVNGSVNNLIDGNHRNHGNRIVNNGNANNPLINNYNSAFLMSPDVPNINNINPVNNRISSGPMMLYGDLPGWENLGWEDLRWEEYHFNHPPNNDAPIGDGNLFY